MTNEREAVRVVVRCRPFSDTEKAQRYPCIVSMDLETATLTITSTEQKTFTFDSIFDWNSTQIQVYNATARPIVDSVLQGYNGTVFAYGQTGTGKTFSMQGVKDVPELRGIIPNAIEHIFSFIKTADKNVKFLVRASYLEIYNEEIRDLLNNNQKLELKERNDVGVYVKDLKSFVIKDLEEMDKLMVYGNNNRATGSTLMNANSSRSHSIFTITVEVCEKGIDGDDHIRVGKLNLVDLAGSERQSKTGASGDRFKEATKINLSLSALGNVISALVDGKSTHIPYRDSKLTRLLQDSLGGNARTLMLATMSPASYNYDESMSSLRYANRAKNIKNKPKINEDPKDAMLREFEEEIKRLKAQLDSEHHDGPVQIEEVEEEEEVEENSQKVKKSTVNQVDISKMQEMVQQEKQIILETKGIEEDERNKLLKDLEVRAKQLETEDNQKRELSLKLAQLEEKLLMGGVSVLDKEEEQRMQLSKKQSEIEEKKRQERDLVYQLKNHEEQNIQIEEEYNTLTEEAASKTRKLKKLWALAVSAKMEVKDLMNEQQRERENLLETVRDITKDLKLKMFIISQYVPTEYIRLLEGFAEYDDMIDGYRIKYMQVAGNNVKMEQEEEWKSREDQFQSYEVGPVLVKKKAKVERVKGATKREVAAPRARGLVVNLKRYL